MVVTPSQVSVLLTKLPSKSHVLPLLRKTQAVTTRMPCWTWWAATSEASEGQEQRPIRRSHWVLLTQPWPWMGVGVGEAKAHLSVFYLPASSTFHPVSLTQKEGSAWNSYLYYPSKSIEGVSALPTSGYTVPGLTNTLMWRSLQELVIVSFSLHKRFPSLPGQSPLGTSYIKTQPHPHLLI